MKKGWTEVVLGEVCNLVNGIYPTMKTEPGDYPLVVTAAYRRSASSSQFDKPAVCIPIVSSTGHGNAAIHRIHYEEGKFALANLLVAAIPLDSSRLVAKYLWRYLSAVKDKKLVPLMQGTANVTLKPRDLLEVSIPLPPLAEQQRIVAHLDAIEQRLKRIQKLREESEKELLAALRSTFHQIEADANWLEMGEVAPLVRRGVDIELSESYTEYGVKSFYKGIFLRRKMLGAAYSWQKLFWLKEGDLVFSNIMAWEKAIGFASQEKDGWVGNHRMLVCETQQNIVLPCWLYYYFTTQKGFAEIEKASPGTAARNKTLKAASLGKIMIPIPNMEKQKQFDKLFNDANKIKEQHAKAITEQEALLPSLLDSIFNS